MPSFDKGESLMDGAYQSQGAAHFKAGNVGDFKQM